MASAPDDFEVTGTQVFDYRREVVVELHGRTEAGEFGVVSYSFTQAEHEGSTVEAAAELEDAHEDEVLASLREAGYSVD